MAYKVERRVRGAKSRLQFERIEASPQERRVSEVDA
jgi:hypothetical protein